MTTQRLIIAAGWLAAAVLAVLVGLVAISVIGDGLTGSAGRPLAESDVARELAAADPLPSEPAPSSPPSSSVPSASAAPSAESRSFSTRAGIFVATCAGGSPLILSMSPAPGFRNHEQGVREGEFRGESDNHNRVKVRVTCVGDTPRFGLESRTD
jgi:hypothetical protein